MAAYVAVIGPADADQTTCELARSVGGLLAAAGVTVVTGGLGGVMAAAADGATSAGGVAVGLLPGADRADGSPHTVLLPTGLGELRNALLVRAADGVIAVGGSWGTMSEIALAQRTGVPVVVLGGWSVHDETGEPVDIPSAHSPESAVTTLLAAIHPPA
ncbi:MAG TPA: dethiobiotin synthetase [Jatrophihabitantaceae bacterium]|nr:dethiobiotin synthetase [Jatrophihabitantaceae bacterium]